MFKRFLLGVMIVVGIMLGAQELGYCEDDNSKKEKKVAKKGYFLYYGGKELKENVIYRDKKREYFFYKRSGWQNILASKYNVFFPNDKVKAKRGDEGLMGSPSSLVYLGLTRKGKLRVKIEGKEYVWDPKYIQSFCNVTYSGKKPYTRGGGIRRLEDLKGAKRFDIYSLAKYMDKFPGM